MTTEPLPDVPPSGLLDYDQAAAYLGVTRTWLEDQAQAGRVERVRLSGRHIRFTRRALDDFIENRTEPVREPRRVHPLIANRRARSRPSNSP